MNKDGDVSFGAQFATQTLKTDYSIDYIASITE